MAASGSMAKVTTGRSRGGLISDRKSARPTDTGTATAIAMTLVTSVPYMNASAPKEPATGSQVFCTRNCVAPAASAGRDSFTSSSTTSPTTARIAPPIATSNPFQTRSPPCAAAPAGRCGGGAASVAPRATASAGGGKRDRPSLDGEAAQRLLDLAHHRLRERRVVERRRGGLAVVHGPPQEPDQRLALRLVGLVPVDEQVRERGDGVGVLARRVRDGHAVVGRDVDAGGGLRRALDGRLHERAVVVPEERHGQLVLVRVRELDVPHGARGRLHEARHALVALRAQARRPPHALAGTDLALPLRAHLREVVREDGGRPGAVGAVDHGDG